MSSEHENAINFYTYVFKVDIRSEWKPIIAIFFIFFFIYRLECRRIPPCHNVCLFWCFFLLFTIKIVLWCFKSCIIYIELTHSTRLREWIVQCHRKSHQKTEFQIHYLFRKLKCTQRNPKRNAMCGGDKTK